MPDRLERVEREAKRHSVHVKDAPAEARRLWLAMFQWADAATPEDRDDNPFRGMVADTPAGERELPACCESVLIEDIQAGLYLRPSTPLPGMRVFFAHVLGHGVREEVPYSRTEVQPDYVDVAFPAPIPEPPTPEREPEVQRPAFAPIPDLVEPVRRCISCGRQLSPQSQRSRATGNFCSACEVMLGGAGVGP